MTYSRSFFGKLILTPTIAVLLLWIVIPLSLTIYYSFQNYNMLDGSPTGYTGWMNYEFFIFDEAFYEAILNRFLIVLSLLLITVFFGFLFASLLNSDIFFSNFITFLVFSQLSRFFEFIHFTVFFSSFVIWGNYVFLKIRRKLINTTKVRIIIYFE